MGSLSLLRSHFNYQAWANHELLEKMEGFDPDQHREERHTALRLMNHCYVVNQIFVGHLIGKAHSFSADNTPDTPTLDELRCAVAALDQWYVEYVRTVSPERLSESVPFVFTDGDKGYMSREEMLNHVVMHGCYHRGEIGRIMRQGSIGLPWDTYAVYLHRTEPSRRLNT